MRILWLSWKSITHPDAGGAETYGHEMAKALVESGHQVTWISLAPLSLRAFHFFQLFKTKNERVAISPIVKDGVQYHYIGNRKLMYTGLFHLFIFINYIIKWRHHFDLIIDEIHGPPLLTPLYVRKPKLTVIHEVAGEIWHKTIPFPFSWLMAHVIEPLLFLAYRNQNIVTVSDSTKNDLVKLGINPQHISIIHNGFNPPQLNIVDIPKETTPTLIFLSEIRPMKGLDRVLKSYETIKQKIPSVKLWIVGNDTLPYAQRLRLKYLDDKSITFYGKLPEGDKNYLLARAHLLVHGSYKEGWGRVVIEANAVGTPAVVFDAEGLREAVQNGQTGFVVENSQVFSEKIVELLSNEVIYDELHRNAILWSKKFNWQGSTQQFLNCINVISNISKR